MPALPIPELPPPDTDGFSPRVDPSRTPRRDHPGPYRGGTTAPAPARSRIGVRWADHPWVGGSKFQAGFGTRAATRSRRSRNRPTCSSSEPAGP